MTQPPKDTKFATVETQHAFKESIKQALLASLDEEIHTALQAATSAHTTASDANNKPENKYDTLALEAAYLAHGQSERILGLQQMRIQVAKWPLPKLITEDPIRLGCYIELLSENGTRQAFFIAPVGGRTFILDGQTVLVVSQQTTLASTLNGKVMGDEVQLTLGNVQQWWEITQVF
ncbi:MAG: hypothetical protein P1U57_14040 [Oleibacter sp.]|nr:hypothetical protein [Thalassolituus sp.]